MGNRYFSQYLLNSGVLEASNIGYIMPKAAHVVPQLYILAIEKGLLSESQIDELSCAEDLAKALDDKKFLSDDQVSSLKNEPADRAACMAQILFDEKIADFKTLNRCFREYNEDDVHPVVDAVQKIVSAHEDMNPVGDTYGEFAEVFIGAMDRFMKTDAVVLTEPAEPVVEGSIIISQSMIGEISLAAGIMCSEDIFLEMSRRYSGEEITQVDDMAEDSLSEFMNVINGLYIVGLSGKDYDMDLETPRIAKCVCPMASSLVAIRIVTDFGSFVLYLAEDEFMY